MTLSNLDWHARYVQQARWTKPLREYLFRKSGLIESGRVLEVGCGTGVLLEELQDTLSGEIHGLDIDRQRLQLAASHDADTCLTCGDAHHLPYRSGAMGSCFCHYLLLWVQEPAAVLAEMVRVTRPGGSVLVLAEPDYGGRIDYPAALEKLGEWQTMSLKNQGANPEMGRRLAGLLTNSGLVSVESGVLGGEWRLPLDQEEFAREWDVVQSDLEHLESGTISQEVVSELFDIEQAARTSGERVLFVPTFYAWGTVP